jgi:capsular exopolysaccharide synthesis family protein
VDLRHYLRILRVRWRLVVVCLLVAVGGAAGLTFLSTPQYAASAQLFVSTSQASADDGALSSGGQFAQQRVKSYAEIVDSETVTSAVIAELGLSTTPDELATHISATAPLNTVLINITVRMSDAGLAQRVANAVAQEFTTVASALERPEGQASSPVKVSVVREAGLPAAPVSPRVPLNLALGLVVGLALGVAAAIARETLDTSLKGAEDVRAAMALPTLGLIAFDPEAEKRPLIVHDHPHSTRSEAFRQVRTNLQFVNVDNPPRSIVVTSALPGEGKSTTTCNLAIALSQAGVRVIVVEADLRRPKLASYLGLEGAVGLTNLLVGTARPEDVIQRWGNTELFVLPSGPTPPNPSELLGSLQMQELLAELESRADLVLLDAPPLLPVTDASVLASLASGAVMVARAGKTTREEASKAAQLLRGVDTEVYGAVLNMVPTKGPGAYRYGSYGYGPIAPADSAPTSRFRSRRLSA